MSKVIPILVATGLLGLLSGCGSQPTPEPVQGSQQEKIAKAMAEKEKNRLKNLARAEAERKLALAESERQAALEAAESAKDELARSRAENMRMKSSFRRGLMK